MLGNIRGTAADRPQLLPIDPWYNLAFNQALRANRSAGRQLSANTLYGGSISNPNTTREEFKP